MIDYYNVVNGILQQALYEMDTNFYDASSEVFDSEFFNVAFACFIAWYGLQIAFKTFKSEETAYKIIWTIFIFSLVKTMLINESLYSYLIEIIDLPRNVLLDVAFMQLKENSDFTTVDEIITTLIASNDLLISTLLSKTRMFDLTPLFLGVVLWLASVLLLLTLFLSTVFSMFIAKVLIILLPLILITLLTKKTQRMFFSYIKVYISISLYTPFAILISLVTIEVTELMVAASNVLHQDLFANAEYILALVLAQLLISAMLMKIPNILNQIVGADNENNSFLSSSLALTSGTAIVGQVSKMFGLRFSGGLK